MAYSVAMSVLLEEALKLPVTERRKLAEDIWESIDGSPEAFELTPEQAAELQRRIDHHEKFPDEGIPWETVRDEALARR